MRKRKSWISGFTGLGTASVMVVASAVMVSALVLTSAKAADLARRDYAYRSSARGIFPGDEQCPVREPLEYKPRTTNFNEPGCYAARPYGLSSRLYDYEVR